MRDCILTSFESNSYQCLEDQEVRILLEDAITFHISVVQSHKYIIEP
jgi:hypothetical protein